MRQRGEAWGANDKLMSFYWRRRLAEFSVLDGQRVVRRLPSAQRQRPLTPPAHVPEEHYAAWGSPQRQQDENQVAASGALLPVGLKSSTDL